MSFDNPRSLTAHTVVIAAESVELLDDAPLTLEQLAQGCRVSPEWVHTHVQAGLLLPHAVEADTPHWRFASATLHRARRIAHLEHTFDADPHLAALAADLMEEVAALRQQLRQLSAL